MSTDATYTCAVAATGDETLADERRRRTQAAASAIAGGVLTLGGGLLTAAAYRDKPAVPVIDALREHYQAPLPDHGLKARQVLWYGDNAFKLILVAALLALAAAMIGLALSHLYRSTKARRPELPRGVVAAAIAGAVLVAVSGLVQAIGLTTQSSSFAGSAHQTAAAARDVLKSPTVIAAGLMQLVGVFGLGLAFVMLALNGMRVGLLTRFMGVLGMIVGVLFIIPIGSSLPIVQTFWLLALGALFLGLWPKGMPPAWVTGEAQPWPTQQQLREGRAQRQAQGLDDDGAERPRRPGRHARAEAPETPAPVVPERRPHPSSKKKKRKRR